MVAGGGSSSRARRTAVLHRPLHAYTKLLLSAVPGPRRGSHAGAWKGRTGRDRRDGPPRLVERASRSTLVEERPAALRCDARRPMTMTARASGLMLYTLRRARARATSRATLRAVAAMGYEGVEPYDLFGHDAARVRGWLDELGLVVCGSARRPRRDRDPTSTSSRTSSRSSAATGSSSRWVAPPPSVGRGRARRGAHPRRSPSARGPAGLRLGFHNHDGELRRARGRAAPCSSGCSTLDAELLFLELDLGWAWFAGVEPERPRSTRAAATGAAGAHQGLRARGDAPSFVPVGDGDVGYAHVAPGDPRPRASNGCWSSRTRSRAASSTPLRRSFAAVDGIRRERPHEAPARVGIVGCGVISRHVRGERRARSTRSTSSPAPISTARAARRSPREHGSAGARRRRALADPTRSTSCST